MCDGCAPCAICAEQVDPSVERRKQRWAQITIFRSKIKIKIKDRDLDHDLDHLREVCKDLDRDLDQFYGDLGQRS